MERAVTVLNNILKKVIACLMAATALIVITNVFCRYVLNFSLTWSVEAASYCMVWAAFIGTAILVNRGEHIVAINAFEKLFKVNGRLVFRMFLSAASAFFFSAVTYYGIQMVIRTRGQVASSIRFLPMNLIYLIIPISGLLMILGEAVRVYGFYREWDKGKGVAE